jgi:hypothetical protein
MIVVQEGNTEIFKMSKRACLEDKKMKYVYKSI